MASTVSVTVARVADADIGDPSTPRSLYLTSNGSWLVGDAGVKVTEKAPAGVTLTRSTSGIWTPTPGASVVALLLTDVGFELIERQGYGTTARLSLWTFDAETGKASTTISTRLTLEDIYARELLLEEAIDGDGAIGAVVSRVSDAWALGDSGQSLYLLTAKSWAVGGAGAEVGASLTDEVVLKTATGAAWSPSIGATVLGIGSSVEGAWQVVERIGAGTTARYQSWTFDAATGLAATNGAVVLKATDLLALEVAHGRDYNGNGKVGDPIKTVIDAEDEANEAGVATLGLYRLESGSFLVATKDLEVGALAEGGLLLRSKWGGAWAPSTGATAIAFGMREGGAVIDVIERLPGTGAARFALWSFDAVTGVATNGISTALSPGQLLAREIAWGDDIDGDELIGAQLASVIDDDDGSGQWGLYRLQNNKAIAISTRLESTESGTAIATPLVLRTQANSIWSIASTSTIAGFGVSASGFEVVDRSPTGGLSATTFVLNESGPTSTFRVTLTAAQAFARELTWSQDLNGDGKLGDVVTAQLTPASASADATLGLYKVASGAIVTAEAGLQVDDLPQGPVGLRSWGGSAWSPMKKGAITGFAQDGDGIWVVEYGQGSYGTGYYASEFKLGALGWTTYTTKLPDTKSLIALETRLRQDVNGDGVVGDRYLKVVDIDNGRADPEGYVHTMLARADGTYTIELHLASDASWQFDIKNGDPAKEPVAPITLRVTPGKPWAPVTGGIPFSIAHINAALEVVQVVDMSSATKVSKTYYVSSFDAATGLARDPARAILRGELLARELMHGQDLDGDGMTPVLKTDAATGVTYALFTVKATWGEAQHAARVLGGQMLILDDASERDQIAAWIESVAASDESLGTALAAAGPSAGGGVPYVWLGASDAIREGKWVWESGSRLANDDPMWGNGLKGLGPDDAGKGEDYLAMALDAYTYASATAVASGSAYALNDLPGTVQLPFVIEWHTPLHF